MSVQFILGAAGSGKSRQVLAMIKDLLLANNHQKVLVLVPEQATFQFEYALAADTAIGGVLSVQVLSFQRLAWMILQESGGSAKTVLTELGKLMVLRQEILAAGETLSLLKSAAQRPGYINVISESIAEFKRYRFSPQTLKAIMAANFSEQSLLGNKLAELTRVYDGYCRRFGAETIDSDDVLELLLQKIPQTDTLADTVIFIDEFHHFLPQEMAILGALMAKARDMVISLTYPVNAEDKILQDRLFKQSLETYRSLKNLAYR